MALAPTALSIARASSESASEASLGGVPSLLRHREAVKKQLVQAEQFSGLFARGQRQIAAHSGPSTNSADLCRELAIIRSQNHEVYSLFQRFDNPRRPLRRFQLPVCRRCPCRRR